MAVKVSNIFKDIIDRTYNILVNHCGVVKVPVKYSRALSFCGCCDLEPDDENRESYHPLCIRISYMIHDKGDDINNWSQNDIDDLIDTVCHEIAHFYYWKHNSAHKELTEEYKDIVKNCWAD